MDKKYLKKFIEIFEALNKVEDDITFINESLEKNLYTIQERISKYELKDSLSDRQEEILFELQEEEFELQDDIDKTTELLEHINDALDLIDFDTNLTNQRVEKLTKQLDKLKLMNKYIK